MLMDLIGWSLFGLMLIALCYIHKATVKTYHSMKEAERLMNSWKTIEEENKCLNI